MAMARPKSIIKMLGNMLPATKKKKEKKMGKSCCKSCKCGNKCKGCK